MGKTFKDKAQWKRKTDRKEKSYDDTYRAVREIDREKRHDEVNKYGK